MIDRLISEHVRDNARWFPVVTVTGPRQSGKSTLVRHLFPDYEYINLEDESWHGLVADSPLAFLRERPGRIVIDEAQRVPELFSAIQVVSDERGGVGQYVLSGSQSFLLHRHITQTLAGRVGMLSLMPLSLAEASAAHETRVEEFMLRGGYPRIYDVGIPHGTFYSNYVATYVERDVTGLVGPGSLSSFRLLLSLCAQSAGELLNVSRLASDAGVARATVDSWLSILEASGIVFRLQPYHANLRKRLTKTPKLYFRDTGLLCHLLGLATWEDLRDSQLRGAVFENFIVAETAKRHLNAGLVPQLYFYRDDSKVEVDLVDLTVAGSPELVEVKSSAVFRDKYTRHLARVGETLGIGAHGRSVVLRSEASGAVGNAHVWSARDWLLR